MIIRKIKNKFNALIIKRKFGKCGTHFRVGKNFKTHNASFISVGNNVTCSDNCELSVWQNEKHEYGKLVIGNYVTAAENSYISCANYVEIGDGTLLGANTFITDNFHGRVCKEDLKIRPNDREIQSKGSVVIGKRVWTGRNTCIMPGVTIGDCAIIGANAVVTHDIPANCVAVGVPARVIKMIND